MSYLAELSNISQCNCNHNFLPSQLCILLKQTSKILGMIFLGNSSDIMQMAEIIMRFHSNILAEKCPVPFLAREYAMAASVASLLYHARERAFSMS